MLSDTSSCLNILILFMMPKEVRFKGKEQRSMLIFNLSTKPSMSCNMDFEAKNCTAKINKLFLVIRRVWEIINNQVILSTFSVSKFIGNVLCRRGRLCVVLNEIEVKH